MKSTSTVGQDKYHHVATVVDGTSATLYVDGAAAGTGTVAARTDDTSAVLVGASSDSGSPGGFLAADVDEVRLWSRAVGAAELAPNRYHRLVGNEAALAAYYRCDEGSGTTLYDETDGAANGVVTGGCTWVTSTAGVGDGPSLSRESFAIAGRNVVSGLAAELYYQQEQAPAGYDGKSQPVKKQGRVLLACATAASAPQAGDRSYVAVLDFAVGRDGRLAQVPMQVTLPQTDRTPAATQDTVSDLQKQLAAVQDRIDKNNAAVAGEVANEDQIRRLEWQRDRPFAAIVLMDEPWLYPQYGPPVPAGEIDGRLATCYAQRATAQGARADNAVAYGERRVLQDRMATASAGMQGSEDVVLPMRFLGMDGAGLSFYGGLLTFAWTNDAPFVMDSASGDVTLYFRGGDGQFFAVYYDTRVQRATKKLDAGGTPLRLAARDPGIAQVP